jgi:hypothetical protein
MRHRPPDAAMQRDMTLYEEAMYAKARRDGMSAADARKFARDKTKEQVEQRALDLERIRTEQIKHIG